MLQNRNESESGNAIACANFALIKYWGKRSRPLNIPAVGSISITVDSLKTTSHVSFEDELQADDITINSVQTSGHQRDRVVAFLDLIRERTGMSKAARINSTNNFVTGAGLASSASGFAALAAAACRAAGKDFSPAELSALARMGSGSAARSVYGGFVEMKTGQNEDGSDAFAVQLADRFHWPLAVIIAVTNKQPKEVSSTDGMEHSRLTSPFYSKWVDTAHADLLEARDAIRNRDFEKLADVAEYNCMKMHAVAMSSRPPVLYWNGTTVRVMAEVKRLRQEGLPVFYTVDAGPQVKAICSSDAADTVAKKLRDIPGVMQLLTSSLGDGVQICPEAS